MQQSPLTHDAAGNVTLDNRAGQAYGYTYNDAGRMESLSVGGTTKETYVYNALGHQVLKVCADWSVDPCDPRSQRQPAGGI